MNVHVVREFEQRGFEVGGPVHATAVCGWWRSYVVWIVFQVDLFMMAFPCPADLAGHRGASERNGSPPDLEHTSHEESTNSNSIPPLPWTALIPTHPAYLNRKWQVGVGTRADPAELTTRRRRLSGQVELASCQPMIA